MHHKEGNGPEDLSTTEPFKRDSFLHWLAYFARFIFLTPFELPLYFFKRNRNDYGLKVIFAYVSFFSILGLSYSYNPQGTITVFFVPTAICWFGLMAGNWTQHAFVDQGDPSCDYKNSITVIDSLYNERCFNDGYHIGHHLRPGMHWTEMPEEFEINRALYKEKKALIFRKLDYQAIWFLLMFKQHSLLFKYYCGEMTKADFLETMKGRLKPLPTHFSNKKTAIVP